MTSDPASTTEQLRESPPGRVGRSARELVRVTTAGIRRQAHEVRNKQLFRRGLLGRDSRITVVMPAKDVERYIDEAVWSVLSQSHGNLELIVVDDASTDGTAQRLNRWQRKDPRLTIITNRESIGPNASRNLAIAGGTGEFLTFVDSDDRLLDGAFRDMLAALRSGKSDFAVGGYDRLNHRRRTPAAPWISIAHDRDRPAVTVDEFPEIMVNVVQWSKLYRRSFWDATALSFPEHGYYQDQIVAAEAYTNADRVDVLARPIVAWRVRDDGSSMTQQLLESRNISDRFSTLAASVRIYRRKSAQLGLCRLSQTLANDVAVLAERLDSLRPESLAALRRGLTELAESSIDPAELPEAPDYWRATYHAIIRVDLGGRPADTAPHT